MQNDGVLSVGREFESRRGLSRTRFVLFWAVETFKTAGGILNYGESMESLYFVKRQNHAKVKDILLKDDVVNRQSVIFKDAASVGEKKDGFYVKIAGLDEAVKKGAELIKDYAEAVPVAEAERVIRKIKSEEESAAAGFGSIFG